MDRTWHQGMTFSSHQGLFSQKRCDFRNRGGMMDRTWHQGVIFSFTPGHVDFTAGDACLSEPRSRHKPGLNRR